MSDLLELFNCMVVDTVIPKAFQPYTGLIENGVITDFTPTAGQEAVLKDHFKPIDIITLFTREERETATLHDLIVKQILHYIEVYTLGEPGLFNLECGDQGKIVAMRFVKGVTVSELEIKVRKLLYTNAPIKDAAQLKRIIINHSLDFDLNKIQNNEMRVILYRAEVDVFNDGDDAVRYLCYLATDETLLIKSPEVIKAVAGTSYFNEFFIKHEFALARVFNRHKRLILAAKRGSTATVINRIGRKSKTQHVPLRESIAKTFMYRALSEVGFNIEEALTHTSLRDKFKYLNLLEKRKLRSPIDSFKIRNGKIWTHPDRPIYPRAKIDEIELDVLNSLAQELMFLQNKGILLDKNVDYGLPVSRKQSIGNLPFGTKVTSLSDEISSGMYWRNSWGASDLDLSTIDLDGNRVGWGGLGGYNDKGIVFSGDLTDARNGAVEFMTSKDKDYGLFVNIYSGEIGAEMELVVGSNSDKRKWIDQTIIREKYTLNSKQSVIGFVKGKTLTIYAGRLNEGRVSGDNPINNESRVSPWTVQRLFYALGVSFDIDRQDEVEYDHDLSYEAFSFDRLEGVFQVT